MTLNGQNVSEATATSRLSKIIKLKFGSGPQEAIVYQHQNSYIFYAIDEQGDTINRVDTFDIPVLKWAFKDMPVEIIQDDKNMSTYSDVIPVQITYIDDEVGIKLVFAYSRTFQNEKLNADLNALVGLLLRFWLRSIGADWVEEPERK